MVGLHIVHGIIESVPRCTKTLGKLSVFKNLPYWFLKVLRFTKLSICVYYIYSCSEVLVKIIFMSPWKIEPPPHMSTWRNKYLEYIANLLQEIIPLNK